MKAIVISNYGGPEMLTVTELPDPVPAEDARHIGKPPVGGRCRHHPHDGVRQGADREDAGVPRDLHRRQPCRARDRAERRAVCSQAGHAVGLRGHEARRGRSAAGALLFPSVFAEAEEVGQGRQLRRAGRRPVRELRVRRAWDGGVPERRPGQNGHGDVEGVVIKCASVAAARREESG